MGSSVPLGGKGRCAPISWCLHSFWGKRCKAAVSVSITPHPRQTGTLTVFFFYAKYLPRYFALQNPKIQAHPCASCLHFVNLGIINSQLALPLIWSSCCRVNVVRNFPNGLLILSTFIMHLLIVIRANHSVAFGTFCINRASCFRDIYHLVGNSVCR